MPIANFCASSFKTTVLLNLSNVLSILLGHVCTSRGTRNKVFFVPPFRHSSDIWLFCHVVQVLICLGQSFEGRPSAALTLIAVVPGTVRNMREWIDWEPKNSNTQSQIWPKDTIIRPSKLRPKQIRTCTTWQNSQISLECGTIKTLFRVCDVQTWVRPGH